MNSPFANLFLAVQQQVQDNITDITYIDQDLGQLRTDKNIVRYPVSWPCLLIDFEDFTYTDMSANAQTAEGYVVLRLGFAPLTSSSQNTPEADKENAIRYYDIEWSLHKLMQGWAPTTDFGALTRTGASTLKRKDSIRVREIRYKLTFEDYSASATQQYASATMAVTPQMNIG